MKPQIDVLDHGFVKLVESWGSDEQVIEAARMSTDKGFQGWGPFLCQDCNGDGWVDCRDPDNDIGPFTEKMCVKCKGHGSTEGDERLLRYLWQHKHTTPFEMAGFSVEMQLPIFVAREIIRHRTFSFNELSARYTPLPDLYYIPSIERLMAGKQATRNKQSSEMGFTEDQACSLQYQIEAATRQARAHYDTLLMQDLSRELARLVIPVNQYTRWRMQGVLLNWLKFLTLRLPENVQWETRQYAEAVASIVQEKFPRTYSLFAEEK